MDPTAFEVLRGTSGCFWQDPGPLSRTSVPNVVASTVSNIETTMLSTEGLDGALTIP
jgi:hypothetical protein